MKEKKAKSLLWKVLIPFIIATLVIMYASIKIFHQTIEDEMESHLYSMMRENDEWLLELEKSTQDSNTAELRKIQNERYEKIEQLDKRIGKVVIVQYIVTFLFILIYLVIMLQVVSKRLWKPFNKTLNTLEDFSIDKGIVPHFQKTDVKEFVRLNNSLEKMIKNSLSIYQSQKEFTENASHELHTPLAIMQSQLDMLIQRPDLTEEQSEIILSIYSDVSHLTRLNNNLLFLAKIENHNQGEKELINISELTENILPNISFMAENASLNFNADIQKACMLKVNKVLYVSLLNNLLINAIHYNYPHGSVNLILTDKEVTVYNTSESPMLDTKNVFRRFNKNQEVSKGHGLGLSIVEKICKYHGWSIEYKYEDSYHIFTVIFNL